MMICLQNDARDRRRWQAPRLSAGLSAGLGQDLEPGGLWGRLIRGTPSKPGNHAAETGNHALNRGTTQDGGTTQSRREEAQLRRGEGHPSPGEFGLAGDEAEQ